MSNSTSDNNSDETDDKLNDSLQGYLDTLLTRSTESSETQLPSDLLNQSSRNVGGEPSQSLETQQHVHPSDFDKANDYSNTSDNNAYAASPMTPVQAFKSKSSNASPSAQYQNSADQSVSRPFAEPVKTKKVSLNIALPSLKEETEIVEPTQLVDSPQVKTVVDPQPQQKRQTEQIDEPVVNGAIESEDLTDSTIEPFRKTVWLDNGRPDWAQEHFECLLFSVGGLTLAVPLVELGTIYPIGDELTPIFGQIDWFMGLMPLKEGVNVRAVNTAKVVMPERYDEEMMEKFSYIISISGVDWGLAVDTVSNAVTLAPEDVKWRSARSKRPWLAGTVIDHMCALLDVSQLAAMFVEQDKHRS